MPALIEYTIASVDGAFDGAQLGAFAEYRDAEYMADGLKQLEQCDALLMGRTTYQQFSRIWPTRTDPWANRLNAMRSTCSPRPSTAPIGPTPPWSAPTRSTPYKK